LGDETVAGVDLVDISPLYNKSVYVYLMNLLLVDLHILLFCIFYQLPELETALCT